MNSTDILNRPRMYVTPADRMRTSNPMQDASGDDHPLCAPKTSPRGIRTADFTFSEDVPVLYAVTSRGVASPFYEASTVGELREVKEELERFLRLVDPIDKLALTLG